LTTTYLDVLGGLDDSAAYKVPCAVATTSDMTSIMIGTPVIDGYQVQAGDRVLVWQNSDETSNGIYDVPQPGGASAWTRSVDFSKSSAIYEGTQVLVVNGTKWGGSIFGCKTQRPVIGTSPITFQINNVLIG